MHEKQINEIKKYLKTLVQVLYGNVIFYFPNRRVICKTRIDDILCCIEANFPDLYKEKLRSRKVEKLKSEICYNELKQVLKRQFLFFSSCYIIKYRDAERIINVLLKSFESDIRFLYKNS